MWWWISALGGCEAEEPVRPPPGPPTDTTHVADDVLNVRFPAGPRGPVKLWWNGAAPSVEARIDGVAVEPVVEYDFGLYWPDAPLAPGEHQFQLDYGEEHLDTTFTVGAFGSDPAFDAQALVGRWWSVEDPGVGPDLWLVDLALDASGAGLQLVAVDGDRATFRFLGFDAACVAFQGEGHLSAEGELTYHADHLVTATDSGPADLWDLDLRVGFLGDDAIADFSGTSATVPWARETMPDSEDDALCELLEFFAECEECPDGSGPTCQSVEVVDAMLAPEGPAPIRDLPPCAPNLGIPDVSIEIPPFDCSLELGCATAGPRVLPLAALAAGWLARRRRSPGPGSRG